MWVRVGLYICVGLVHLKKELWGSANSGSCCRCIQSLDTSMSLDSGGSSH